MSTFTNHFRVQPCISRNCLTGGIARSFARICSKFYNNLAFHSKMSMRFRHLLPPAIFLLTLCNVSLAQRSGYKPVYAQDSLAGFDEESAKKMAFEEGALGDNFKTFMDVMKRRFINGKYNLDPIVEYADFPSDLL